MTLSTFTCVSEPFVFIFGIWGFLSELWLPGWQSFVRYYLKCIPVTEGKFGRNMQCYGIDGIWYFSMVIFFLILFTFYAITVVPIFPFNPLPCIVHICLSLICRSFLNKISILDIRWSFCPVCCVFDLFIMWGLAKEVYSCEYVRLFLCYLFIKLLYFLLLTYFCPHQYFMPWRNLTFCASI